MKNIREAVYDVLFDLTNEELFLMWNEYCVKYGSPDDMIRSMESLNWWSGLPILELAMMMERVPTRWDRYWWLANGKIRFAPPWEVWKSPMNVDLMIDAIIQNSDDFGHEVLSKALNAEETVPV